MLKTRVTKCNILESLFSECHWGIYCWSRNSVGIRMLSWWSVSGSSPSQTLLVEVLKRQVQQPQVLHWALALLWSLNGNFWSWGFTGFWFVCGVHTLNVFWRCCVQHRVGTLSRHKEFLFFILWFSGISAGIRSVWMMGIVSRRGCTCRWCGLSRVLCTVLRGPFRWAGITV